MARSIKKGSVVVAVGTKKGGFLFHSPDRKKWSVAGPFMEGGSVYHMMLDPRDGRTVYASAPMGSEPWRPGRVPPERVSGVGPVRAQARLGRIRGRLPLSAEPLRDLPSRTGRWSVDGSHEGPAIRFRISDRRPSEAEAHRVRGAVGRRGEPRLPQGPNGRLEDDEQRQSVAPDDEGFARPGRLPRGAPRGHGRRCRGSDWRVSWDEHGAALREPRRRRIVEDDQRLPSAHLLRHRGNRTVTGTRR